MTLRISGKSISVGDALRSRVSERTDEVLRKYFDGNYSGHITLSKDGFGFRTDCALHLDSGITLEADSNATDAYASADQALLMIEKRLRRYKSRLKDRSSRKAYAASAAFAEMEAPVLDAPSYVHLPYRMGTNLVQTVIRNHGEAVPLERTPESVGEGLKVLVVEFHGHRLEGAGAGGLSGHGRRLCQ